MMYIQHYKTVPPLLASAWMVLSAASAFANPTTASPVLFLPPNPVQAVSKPVDTLHSKLAQLVVPQQPATEGPTRRNQGITIDQFDNNPIGPVTLRAIIIEGNQRISEGRILQFFDLKVGQVANAAIVNIGLQKLFQSGLFQDFEADLNDQGVLTVKVTENPIINRVAFEGNRAIKDELLETAIGSRPRQSYSVSMIDADVRAIQAAYRQSGRYATEVNPVIIKRDQNRVDLVFEIHEGNKTRVQSINFVGNHFASDKALQDEMLTKKNTILSYVFGGDSYDPDKLAFDTDNIRNYYLRHGFADFRIVSATSELNASRDGFDITVTMEEGERYRFGEIAFQSEIPEVDPVLTRAEAITVKRGQLFDNTQIQDTVLNIENSVQRQGIPFVRTAPQVRKNNEELVIDVTFVVSPGPRRYVEEININNNVRTLDYVIRRELTIAEGDPLSPEKIRESERRLENLGFFKKVNIIQRQGTFANDTVLDVNVEEKSTGAIDVGVGLSTSTGTFVRLGISEDNFLGRGQRVALSSTFGKNTNNYNFSFTEPRFLERDLSATFTLGRFSNTTTDSRKFDVTTTSSGLSFQQQLYQNVSHGTSVSISKSLIDNVQSDASNLIKLQSGSVRRINIGQSLSYRNGGLHIGGSVIYSGLMDNYSALKTVLNGSYTIALGEQSQLSISGTIGYLKDFGSTKSKISDNFFIGGENDVRGFESAGIGPRINLADDKGALGGQKMAKGSISVKFPSGLPRHVGLNMVGFIDFGVLTHHGQVTSEVPINQSNKVRVSVGIGMQLETLLPISILLAKPLRYEPWDETETFAMSIGTTF